MKQLGSRSINKVQMGCNAMRCIAAQCGGGTEEQVDDTVDYLSYLARLGWSQTTAASTVRQVRTHLVLHLRLVPVQRHAYRMSTILCFFPVSIPLLLLFSHPPPSRTTEGHLQ